MTALELLTDLRDRGVKLWVDGADLRFSARKGTLGKVAAEQLARHKTELVELLKSPSTGAARRDQDSATGNGLAFRTGGRCATNKCTC
jgi:TubC N-terminal docking domain